MRERSSYDTVSEWLADRTKHPPGDHDLIAWSDYVEGRLEFAGVTQIALYSRVWPAGYRNLWGSGSEEGRRYAYPTARAVTLMDQAHGWILQCLPDFRARILVGRRTLIIPDSRADKPQYVWPWSRLVEAEGHAKSGANIEAVRRRWMTATGQIVREIAGTRSGMPPRLASGGASRAGGGPPLPARRPDLTAEPALRRRAG